MAMAPSELVRLLREVPTYYRRVRSGLSSIEIYDDALEFIAANRSDDFAEWGQLEQIIWQDQALLRETPQEARDSATPSKGTHMSATEHGWVIERDLHSQLHYWAGRNSDDWRHSHTDAVRFARRTDAELMLTYHCGGIGRVAEHTWHADGPITVFINSEPYVLPSPRVSYEQLVKLAGKTCNPTVAVSFGDRDRAGRALCSGQTIDLDSGAHVMVVHARHA